jgi:predicted RNA-binding protein YlqC (UPF0109 family)
MNRVDDDVTTQKVADILKDLTLSMAWAVVSHPDQLQIDVAINNGAIALQLSVDSTDMGRIIGKRGRVANAMRILLYACAAKEGKRVYLDIIQVS